MNNKLSDFNSAVEFYKKFLNTPALDWQNEMRRPVRSNIFKAMCEIHATRGQDPQQLIDSVLQSGGRLLFWSDHHFFHKNIIEYAERPFDSVGKMNHAMIENYKKNVRDNDVVVFGGDIAFGELEAVSEMLQELPGKKILVLGNHDFHKNRCDFLDYGCFDVITLAFIMQREIDGVIHDVIVTHYPIAAKILPKQTINIHGHTHQQSAGPKNINMSVEHTGFTPVCMEDAMKELVRTIKKMKI